MAFFLFLFGLAVGSFLNVVIYRLNHHLPKGKIIRFGKLGGRSFCPRCQRQLLWQDNVPLVSFVLLRGKCRFCRQPISWQYPLVELATGVMFLFVYWGNFGNLDGSGWAELAYFLLLVSVLIVVFVSDLRYLTIPDEVVAPMAIIGSVYQAGRFCPLTATKLVMIFWPAGAGAAFFWLLLWLTKGKGMGWGDVKLGGVMGLILGWQGLIIAIYLAFLTGAMVGGIMILSRKKRFGEQIPFGPFLVIGTLVALFWKEPIWQIISAVLL
jgi:leader peptidase (prepilin peptidase)/N-methyltransferase